MKLSRLGEFGLIKRIQRAAPSRPGIRVGIGDDAAWLENPAKSSLVTADLLLEGIHFDLKWISFFELGYKSLAVNLSDIAAMGGTAAYAILSLGIPVDLDVRAIDEFYRGVRSAARPHRVGIAGGDTNRSKSLVISICVIGHPPARPVQRNGARRGDEIYVTGTIGDSALGLKLLLEHKALKNKNAVQLIKRHLRPAPRLALGALLAKYRLATAMIDVSDGLLQDLEHICRASGVGAVLCEDQLPLSDAFRAFAGREAELAWTGGEDYELLFCARKESRDRIDKLSSRTGVTITRVGVCVAAASGITVLDKFGRRQTSAQRGHDHFKRK